MTRLSESIQLLGLVVTTIPFDYADNVVTAEYNGHVDIADLEIEKDRLRADLEVISTEDDVRRREIDDDLYFLDKIISFLEAK